MKKLHSLFNPKSVCVVGSSKLKEKGNLISPEIFQSISHNLQTFFKRNASVVDIETSTNFPKADLYVVSLPEKSLLENISSFKCETCIILPGNYSHRTLLIKRMEEKNIRFLGPNSVCGIINTENGLNTTFEKNLHPVKGSISLIVQSGGVGASLFDLSIFTGIAKLIWVGNEWDISFSELLKYLSKDRQTKAIGMYIEGLKNGKEFFEIARKIRKPLVALKGGISESGAKRALSHTASMAGSSEVYSSVFKQSGIVEVESMRELYEISHILSKQQKMRGKRIAIVSNVGGPSILAADYSLKQGLELPEFSERTIEAIRKKYSEISSINPLDVIADADIKRFEFCLSKILRDKFVDGVLVINMLKSCTLQPEETQVIAKIIRKAKKPVVDCVPAQDDWKRISEVMNREDVFVFDDLQRAVKALRAIYDNNMFR